MITHTVDNLPQHPAPPTPESIQAQLDRQTQAVRKLRQLVRDAMATQLSPANG